MPGILHDVSDFKVNDIVIDKNTGKTGKVTQVTDFVVYVQFTDGNNLNYDFPFTDLLHKGSTT